MSYKKFILTILPFLAGGVFLLASTVFADVVEQELGRMPATVRESAREMIQKGVSGDETIQFIKAMHTNRFDEEQILKALNIVLEAQSRGLPVKPVISKALEGMAKKVTHERTLQAMEAVSSRYAFAFSQARSVTRSREQTERVGSMLAESLAAGLKEQDAARIMSRLREQTAKINSDRMNELAAACLAMARDMSRLGVSSQLSSQVILGALSKGLHAADIANMHQSLLAKSQTGSAQVISRGLAQEMQYDRSVKDTGVTAGEQSGHDSQSGSGGSSNAGSGGSGGGSGGGDSGAGGGGGGGNK